MFELRCQEGNLIAPDELVAAYEELSAELAYAQTHFRESPVTRYLSDLTLVFHTHVYRRRQWRLKDGVRFFTKTVPQAFYEGRRYLLLSLLLFLLGAGIGILSQIEDPRFARTILGDYYVEMTLMNIAKGTPTAVYADDGAWDMFWQITTNNIGVALQGFASGLLTFFGTGMMILFNSVMVGCFQTFFVQQGVGLESSLAIWLHGTLEISSIIVSGAAGLLLGTGWLFPGSYSRMEAFRRSSRRALHILFGVIPLFVVAGFIESYMTRHSEWPDAIRAAIILASAAFIVYYVVVRPWQLNHSRKSL